MHEEHAPDAEEQVKFVEHAHRVGDLQENLEAEDGQHLVQAEDGACEGLEQEYAQHEVEVGRNILEVLLSRDHLR